VDLWRRISVVLAGIWSLRHRRVVRQSVGAAHLEAWLKKNTRAIFVETPTNPLLRVIDLEPIATLCKTEGLALLVDSPSPRR